MSPSSSSSSSQPASAHSHEPDPDPSSPGGAKHRADLERAMVKNRQPTTKPLDLDSYFDDLPDRSSRTKRSKHPIAIARPARKALRLRGVPKSRARRPTPLTVPPSRDEKLEYDSDDDSDEDDGADAAWVRERWNELMDRQRLAEADVRRTILNRDRLGPSELARWLDSEDTCTLPLPTLGVQLRMMKHD